ncbi:MAG: transketolase [Coprothermobacterota bacterium]|nr:transketolase [Coprothermobacterota bacterium]
MQRVEWPSVQHHWEKTKEMADQCIDITLNYRQSGHPGGSRSKVHILIATLLSGVMRYDLRDPTKRFADRFILTAGHTVPLVYCTLAVLNHALRLRFQQTGDPRYKIKQDAVYPEDLLLFRRRGGLPGHAEFSGKTLFLKFNTGPSAHGSPAAVGEAFALKRAGVGQVKVFALEGDAALTPGAVHESANTAWALGLDNLNFLIDWNNFGIDDHPLSDTVYGTPEIWFSSHGWRVFGTEKGSDFPSVLAVLNDLVESPGEGVPAACWFKTRKGRGYGIYDSQSHGLPHPPNSPQYWETKREFQEKYGIDFDGYGHPMPSNPQEFERQTATNLTMVMEVLRQDQDLIDYLAQTLANLGEQVPTSIPDCIIKDEKNVFRDQRLFDLGAYPPELFANPGEKLPNRAALAKFGAWVNAWSAKEYGRPLFIVCSADLAESTNIAGFAKSWGEFPGWGTYNKYHNRNGVLLPQEITEFANAGIMVGMASVNLSENPSAEFDGFWGACSTYGSFAYLKYGMMRLFSQLAQDCSLKVGKVIWIAGHSGPETADDSRTHFGIFEPGVTQLFPQGHVVNLHPWEYNEVPVVLGAALKTNAPIVVLHLTRPAIVIPDRKELRIPSHLEAARGAYLIRDHKPDREKMGTVIIQGTSTTDGMLQLLPWLEKSGYNLKIVAAISHELFLLQDEEYRHKILPREDWLDSMVITTEALLCMRDWVFSQVSADYSLSSDWDRRWRTGGKIEEVLEEAHLTPSWLMQGIERFVVQREMRRGQLQAKHH